LTVTGATLTVAARFCGPPDSGNGGYVAGRLAAYVDGSGPVTVTLRRPPPLDVDLAVETTPGLARLLHGDDLVADASGAGFTAVAAPSVSTAEALAAQPSYPGLRRHPFPTCFVCGHGRPGSDGLGLMPGRNGRGRTACVWTPDASVADPGDETVAAEEFVWAALDCPGGWTSDLEARPLVLGRITAQCDRPPEIGARYVVVGAFHGTERRKTFTSAALYDGTGSLLARAEHVWIAVDAARG
jgi:hypothetical protein